MKSSMIIDPHKLKVVSILDEFSYNCFKYECNLVQLHIDTWRETIIRESPDFLLVESAWRGVDNSWEKKIRALNISGDKNLKSLISFCKKLKIPTVFWNKEDPFHFPRFIDTAKLFDYIFTTSQECIEKYKNDLNHENVYLLPFAAQPMIHNPIGRNEEKLGDVAFAGTWYGNRYPERNKSLEILLSSSARYTLDIYDRTYNIPYPEKSFYEFPNAYTKFVKGSLDYLDMVETYKKYTVFLNVNSITDSSSMFSRRVLELLACGTPVISNYSLGIELQFNTIVQIAHSKDECAEFLRHLLSDSSYCDKLSLLGQRAVFAKHTYSARLRTILEKVSMNSVSSLDPGVTIISIANTKKEFTDIISNFNSQNYQRKELLILAKNNLSDSFSKLIAPLKSPNIKILSLLNCHSFYDCVNMAKKSSTYDFLSFFNESDYYTPFFLNDIMNTFKYSRTLISGKACYYELNPLNKLSLMSPKSEYSYVSHLNPYSMVFHKSIIDNLKLNLFDQSHFWKTLFTYCLNNNIQIFSSDRFNYLKLPDTSSYITGLTKDRKFKGFLSKITL